MDTATRKISSPNQSSERDEDYDVAYLDRAENALDDSADLPLFFSVAKPAKIVTSAELLDRCAIYLAQSDIDKVKDAFRCADEAHLGQFRKSGEPYITHPLAVASILAQWHMDADTICAGLLHDVLEDTGMGKFEMVQRFGIQIADLVDGVSKLTKISFSSNEIAQAESFRKMLLAMSRDVRVILVKLADRLHNMRTLGVMRPEKRRRIATETLEIYVPIAHRLGLNGLFRELQELAFINQYPRRYEILRINVLRTRDKRRAVLERILKETREALPKSNIRARIQGRDKTIYGIYNRMRDSHASFSDVLDVYGFRIIVRTVEECYLTLGALHKLYKPVNRRFKDFIAIPKANGYQSLHTTVIGPSGTPVEYQIRTEKMHRIAEKGILAHWLYGDGMDTSEIQNLVSNWLQSLMEIQRTTSDPSEFIENIKIDLFPDRIYVFTPKSRILSLPQGATPIDFAYQIHTGIGNGAVACRVNGEEAPLSKKLRNGDMVEILTDPTSHPAPEWLRFVRTGKARAKIREFLRERNPEESVNLGQEALKKAALEAKLDINTVPEPIWYKILKETNEPNRQALLQDVGLGKLFAAVLISRITSLAQEKAPATSRVPVTIHGTEGVAVQLAGCCHPIPGDEIWGFMRTGLGLSVHRADCDHVSRGRKLDSSRWMPAQWKEESQTEALFAVPVLIVTTDERATLARTATELAKLRSSITGVGITDQESGKTHTVRLMIQVRDTTHLERILQEIKGIETVVSVCRMFDSNRPIPVKASN
ncbi:MAG: bifunctional (p)ppGpp synthetase/guanosine-3',5'-bis(diphosphate) 3'-pyrophosphohydrolase [Sutterella sp.]|nr:bifunctional (p)ppGpp synthetase/guanosine-3',5'-bis(diphosphate) 3'-pyrophosphohydrolase [Sutterella sp.]